MTTDFRALCAELSEAVLADDSYIDCREIACRARAALADGLADGPAVPTVMEIVELADEIEAAGLGQVDLVRAALTRWGNPAPQPAAVTGQPSDEELADTYWKAWHAYHDRTNSVLHSVGLRAVLARWGRPAPAPPADGEVAELVRMLTGIAYWRRRGRPGECDPSPFDIRQAARLTRAAELLERLSPPQPVPVSERPWEREGWCDPGGLCWLGSDALDGCTPTWLYGSPAWAERFPNVHRVSLPAHALPLPEVDE